MTPTESDHGLCYISSPSKCLRFILASRERHEPSTRPPLLCFYLSYVSGEGSETCAQHYAPEAGLVAYAVE